MYSFGIIFEKKSHIFTAVTLAIIGIIAIPIIIPHIQHTFHFMHILLHIGELILAAFVGVLSIVAYQRMRTRRLFFTMIAFSSFIIAASLTLIEAVWSFYYYIGGLSLLDVSHIFLVITVGMLSLGAFRND